MGLLILIIGSVPISGSTRSIVDSPLIINKIWSESYENKPDEWWIFIIFHIDESYWENIDSYSLVGTIQGQTIELIHDPSRDIDELQEKIFIGRINGYSSGNYLVSIEWKDEITSKVWFNEELQLGSKSHIEKFHEISPPVILVAILILGVIFPGKTYSKIKEMYNNNQE